MKTKQDLSRCSLAFGEAELTMCALYARLERHKENEMAEEARPCNIVQSSPVKDVSESPRAEDCTDALCATEPAEENKPAQSPVRRMESSDECDRKSD
ncbi:hypothetical protein AOLI_G00326880 [Acnodon oligacanthus]